MRFSKQHLKKKNKLTKFVVFDKFNNLIKIYFVQIFIETDFHYNIYKL